MMLKRSVFVTADLRLVAVIRRRSCIGDKSDAGPEIEEHILNVQSGRDEAPQHRTILVLALRLGKSGFNFNLNLASDQMPSLQ